MQDEKFLIADCRQLLENILSEAPENHEFILAIVAKADKPGVIYPDSESSFPNFYGYILDRTKMYMMTDLKVTSNVPRQGSEMRIMTAHYLVYWDKIINGQKNKPLSDKFNQMAEATWAWTSNTSKYKNAELIMVFRSEAREWLNKLNKQIVPPEDRDYWYENYQLYIKLANGSYDEFDFSKAKLSRKIFETFWALWNRDGAGEYTVKQISERYKKICKES